MTIETDTRQYWEASFAIRRDVDDARRQFAARLILPRLSENGETEAVRKAARQVCLGYGITPCTLTLHAGGPTGPAA